MYRFEGYDSFVTAYPENEFPRLKNVEGLRVERVPRITGNWTEDSLAWLRENAKRIDVLNLYHLTERTFRQTMTYKLHNPRGKIYLKFDGAPFPARFRLWRNIKPGFMLMMCRLVSTELEENAEILTKRWHRKITCVPNPISPNEIQEFKPFGERSNTILTVGRIGTRQKASEILLEAFARIAAQIPNWTLKMAGSISENKNIADDFYAAHPELKERVLFTGHVADRDELTEIYRDAKIFAFPSRFEGCSIALAEALTNGLFACASNIRPNELMTQHFKYALGSDVDDIDGLASSLLHACTHESESERLALEGREATLRRCDMKRVCSIISEGLK